MKSRLAKIGLRILAVLLILLTVLPFVGVGQWYVRVWDFPRLQILIGIAIVTAAVFWWLFKTQGRRSRIEAGTWTTLLIVAGIWQALHLLPFTPVWSVDVPDAKSNQNSHIRTMVVNLKYENREYQNAIDVLAATEPDLLVLMEVDAVWARRLQDLEDRYPYRFDEVRGNGLGMSLWSRYPLKNQRKRYLVSDRRVSLWATLQLDNQPIHVVGIHPTPPGLKDSTGESRRDSRVRDAELVIAAREIGQQESIPWIVAGDFNDVAWSHTTRLFKRLSELRDPRIGRSFLGTFPSKYPFVRVPIDHVFVSDEFQLRSMDRKYLPGSDHFAVVADFQLVPAAHNGTPEKEPDTDDQKEASELIQEGQKDAQKRGVD